MIKDHSNQYFYKVDPCISEPQLSEHLSYQEYNCRIFYLMMSLACLIGWFFFRALEWNVTLNSASIRLHVSMTTRFEVKLCFTVKNYDIKHKKLNCLKHIKLIFLLLPIKDKHFLLLNYLFHISKVFTHLKSVSAHIFR